MSLAQALCHLQEVAEKKLERRFSPGQRDVGKESRESSRIRYRERVEK